MTGPRLNLVFGVKVRVENPDYALKPGMPIDAVFQPLGNGDEPAAGTQSVGR